MLTNIKPLITQVQGQCAVGELTKQRQFDLKFGKIIEISNANSKGERKGSAFTDRLRIASSAGSTA